MPNEPGPADTPFAQRLHALLSERGWTQERLAYESGITLGTISRLYRGITKEPRGPTRAGLARGLGIPVWELDGSPVPQMTQLDRIEEKLDAVHDLMEQAAKRDREGFLRALSDLLDPPNGTRTDGR